MKDPESGELIVENDELKKASVKYVSKLLTNRNPKEEFKEDFCLMESLHEIRKHEPYVSQVEISDEDFNDFLKQISQKRLEKATTKSCLLSIAKSGLQSQNPPAGKRQPVYSSIKGKTERMNLIARGLSTPKRMYPKDLNKS